ncbi:MAG: ABC transporter permease subunit [Oscillospiraceae bacterium]|nr:ABC transporter permease subunit [Oscillospiraceae bacterium]
MSNIIRADIYRIVRGKGLYITLAVFLAIILLPVVSGTSMNSGISYSAVEAFDSMEGAGGFMVAVIEVDSESMEIPEPPDLSDFFQPPTGAEAPFRVLMDSHNILYFLLPLIVFVGSADFSSGAAKNTLSHGVSRAKYYGAKLILSCVFCALLLLAYAVLSILAATVFNGFGGTFDGAYVLDVVKIFLPQLWLCLAGACVVNFFVFLFRQRDGAVSGLFIAFMLVPGVAIFALSYINDWFRSLFDYELTMNIGRMVEIGGMSAGDTAKALLVGAGYIALAVAGGFAVFKKAEIK